MDHLHIATRAYLDTLISKRPGETKLGEQVQTIHTEHWEELTNSTARFVLLGIPEDIGVRANYGVGGAHTGWEPSLKALMNVQHTTLLKGEHILLLGAFDFRDMMQRSAKMDVLALRELVAQVDHMVAPVIEKIILAGKVPIVIGGGHNNAFPLLQGASLAMKEKLNCINLDAHSDYRIMEGRHSGNGFHYARRKGYLDRYAVVGLHENYNPQSVIDELAGDHDLQYSCYEDIFLREKITFSQAVKDALQHTRGKPRGVELDIDSIERGMASAATPCGVTALQARQYLCLCGQAGNSAYLHITEGATHLRSGKDDMYICKLIAYLVTDFMKSYIE